MMPSVLDAAQNLDPAEGEIHPARADIVSYSSAPHVRQCVDIGSGVGVLLLLDICDELYRVSLWAGSAGCQPNTLIALRAASDASGPESCACVHFDTCILAKLCRGPVCGQRLLGAIGIPSQKMRP
jgi:hypothetical protein